MRSGGSSGDEQAGRTRRCSGHGPHGRFSVNRTAVREGLAAERGSWAAWVPGELTMNESNAIALAKAHASQWSVPWRQVVKTEKVRAWWYFSTVWYRFTIDTGDGRVDATIHASSGTVDHFEYYP